MNLFLRYVRTLVIAVILSISLHAVSLCAQGFAQRLANVSALARATTKFGARPALTPAFSLKAPQQVSAPLLQCANPVLASKKTPYWEQMKKDWKKIDYYRDFSRGLRSAYPSLLSEAYKRHDRAVRERIQLLAQPPSYYTGQRKKEWLHALNETVQKSLQEISKINRNVEELEEWEDALKREKYAHYSR